MNINLHIDRLVLDGVNIATSQQYMLRSSVIGELTRMLTESGVSSGLVDGNTPSRLNTDSIQLSNSNPTQIGQQIAQSIYGGISHE